MAARRVRAGRRIRAGWWARRSLSALAGLVLLSAAVPSIRAAAAPASEVGAILGPWRLEGHYDEPAPLADQGLATLSSSRGTTSIVYRGGLSIPLALRLQGWTHVGDPGGWRGYLVDAYQSAKPDGEKLFAITTPSGVRHDFVHRLAPGEEPNNSFAAVSPDGQWLVSGEWGRMTRLLVFPTPLINPAGRDGSSLPLAATISLDHPVRDVQGCTFVTATELLCSSDDPGTELWPTPRQLLEVTLPERLTGAPVTATVRSLGELPTDGACSGAYEVEGIDYQAEDGVLRVEVTPPGVCGVVTTVYEYVPATRTSSSG
jgi:hypothetical protein